MSWPFGLKISHATPLTSRSSVEVPPNICQRSISHCTQPFLSRRSSSETTMKSLKWTLTLKYHLSKRQKRNSLKDSLFRGSSAWLKYRMLTKTCFTYINMRRIAQLAPKWSCWCPSASRIRDLTHHLKTGKLKKSPSLQLSRQLQANLHPKARHLRLLRRSKYKSHRRWSWQISLSAASWRHLWRALFSYKQI